jgi:predicted RNA-binding Zn-ribbon protein involved in translation (DUF1610 family)
MKPEFTIEQIREFVAKGYNSVSARYVKSKLEHYDEAVKSCNIHVMQRSEIVKRRCSNCGVDELFTKNDYCNCCGAKQQSFF